MNSSASEFGKDLGLMHEVVVTARKAGFSREEWALLAHNESLCRDIRDVLTGHAQIKPFEHVVDLGADPCVPKDWSVVEHRKGKVAKLERKGDNLYLDGRKIEFFLSKEQSGIRLVRGNELFEELKKHSVLNANVLDYLLKHPHLIPETWKMDENGNSRYVFFWGTVYRGSSGRLSVRCLGRYCAGWWGWGSRWIDDGWSYKNPALVVEC
jgi:hypothetical protein